VPDQPALETALADLGMELAGKHVMPKAERLIWTHRGRGEKLGPIREVEGVTMPMQHRHPSEMA
jgi:hypothetical protein